MCLPLIELTKCLSSTSSCLCLVRSCGNTNYYLRMRIHLLCAFNAPQTRSAEDRSPRSSPRGSPTPSPGLTAKKYVVPKPSTPLPVPPKEKRSLSPAPPSVGKTSKPDLPHPPRPVVRAPPPRPANNDEVSTVPCVVDVLVQYLQVCVRIA